MFELVKSPCSERIFSLAESCERKFTVIAPFIKQPVADELLECLHSDVESTCITSMKLHSFLSRASDIQALRAFESRENGALLNLQRLHAKVYIADDARCIVSSANPTYSGLNSNVECGVFSDDNHFVSDVLAYFPFDENRTRDDMSEITQVSEATLDRISCLMKEQKIQLPKHSEAEREDNDLVLLDPNAVGAQLNGWQADVFAVVASLDGACFIISDVYAFENQLAQKHPDNKNVKPKIRQILQQLRDLGLLEFVERGRYRKLWISRSS